MSFEVKARRYLESLGMKFVAANVSFRDGELDLIMQDQLVWVFVEVRYRRNANFGGAAASVTRRKQKRLLVAAAMWLSEKGMSLESVACRFDVLAITGYQLQWLPNAFNADDDIC